MIIDIVKLGVVSNVSHQIRIYFKENGKEKHVSLNLGDHFDALFAEFNSKV